MQKRALVLVAAATTLTVASPAYAIHRNHGDQNRDHHRHHHYRFYNDHDGHRYRPWPAVPVRVPRPIPFGAAWAAPWLNDVYHGATPYFDHEKSDSGFLLF